MRTDEKLCCLKTSLTISLWILWLVGAAIFGVLLWLRLDFWTNEYLELNSKLDHYLILIYVSLVAGAVITVFSVLGLIGGCLKIKWLLAVYLMIVVLAILMTVSAVVYGIFYRHELRNTLSSDNLLSNIIKTSYRNDHTHRISHVVDIMQSKLECCGAEDPLDYDKSNWGILISSNSKQANQIPVPATCCKEYFHSQNDSQTCFVYEMEDKTKSSDIWQNGCEESLQQFLCKYVVIVITVAALFFILQVICMIICSMYIRVLKSLYVPQPDDIVYDMARNQEKSPYPSRGDYREYYN